MTRHAGFFVKKKQRKLNNTLQFAYTLSYVSSLSETAYEDTETSDTKNNNTQTVHLTTFNVLKKRFSS
jgi:hypothetical protein